MEFFPSRPLTVGVEIELQLLDPKSLDLVNGIQPLLDRYPDSPYIKPEFIQNTVEIASKVGDNTGQIHEHLTDITRELKQACTELDMELCAAGTHPFSLQLGLFTPLPRYLQMEKVSGYLGHAQITYATHVHVGVRNAEEAIFLMHAFKAYLPILIALSASSPYWRGYDTGFASYRHCILAASRSYGIPPSFDNWQQFLDFFYASQKAGIISSVNDIHWDIRIRPHLGTVEIRVMDAQPTLSEAMELAAFIRILAAYLLEHRENDSKDMPQALPWWIEKDNHYTASRLGMNANCVVEKSGRFRPINEVWLKIQSELGPYAKKIGETAYYDRLVERLTGQPDLSYRRQRRLYDQTASFKSVVSALTREFENDLYH